MYTPSDVPGNGDAGAGVSRRSVVKAGAVAAWSVPLVQLATAAPALAVSGLAKLQILGFSLDRERKHTALDVKLSGIRNRGTGSSGQVTVVAHVPKTKKGALSGAPKLSGTPSKGWRYVGRTGPGPWDFTFITTTGLPAGRTTPQLWFRLKLVNNGMTPAVPITATAFAPGVNAVATSRNFH